MSENVVPADRPAAREAAYKIIDGESDYQDAGKGNAAPHIVPETGAPRANGALTPGEGLLCIEQIVEEARAAWYKPDGWYKMLPYIRKIAGVSVQLLENYGAPPREGYDPFLIDSPDQSPLPSPAPVEEQPLPSPVPEAAPDSPLPSPAPDSPAA